MATEFVREVLKRHLGEVTEEEISSDPSPDVFTVLTRLQLESLIEQVSPESSLKERETIGLCIFIKARVDGFRRKHDIAVKLPKRNLRRKLPSGKLALLTRAELEHFARFS